MGDEPRVIGKSNILSIAVSFYKGEALSEAPNRPVKIAHRHSHN